MDVEALVGSVERSNDVLFCDVLVSEESRTCESCIPVAYPSSASVEVFQQVRRFVPEDALTAQIGQILASEVMGRVRVLLAHGRAARAFTIAEAAQCASADSQSEPAPAD